MIEAAGGKVAGSVSKKTDFVVAGTRREASVRCTKTRDTYLGEAELKDMLLFAASEEKPKTEAVSMPEQRGLFDDN